jgi:hypothetical protein
MIIYTELRKNSSFLSALLKNNEQTKKREKGNKQTNKQMRLGYIIILKRLTANFFL